MRRVTVATGGGVLSMRINSDGHGTKVRHGPRWRVGEGRRYFRAASDQAAARALPDPGRLELSGVDADG